MQAPTGAMLRRGVECLIGRFGIALANPFAVAGSTERIGLALGAGCADELPADYRAEFAQNLGEACAALLAKVDVWMYLDKRAWGRPLSLHRVPGDY